MSDLNSVVSVSIDVQTQSIARASFGIPAVFGVFTTGKTTPAFTRARAYASLDEMYSEGWREADPIYLAVRSLFSQDPRPAQVVVGRRDVSDATWTDALAAIRGENDDWYAFVAIPTSDGTSDAELLSLGAWALAQEKLYFAQSSTAGIYDPASTTDILSELHSNGRTVLLYRSAPRIAQYTHAGWLGEGLPWPVGSSQWAYKTAAGSNADALSTSQKNAINAKNGNFYATRGGVDVFERGKVANGEWIDVVMGIDWLKANLQEDIYAAMVNTRKLDYDDAGILIVVGIVQNVLERASHNGILQLSSISVSAPKYKDIATADKQARKLPDVTFRALLKGAILSTELRGTVSL